MLRSRVLSSLFSFFMTWPVSDSSLNKSHVPNNNKDLTPGMFVQKYTNKNQGILIQVTVHHAAAALHHTWAYLCLCVSLCKTLLLFESVSSFKFILRLLTLRSHCPVAPFGHLFYIHHMGFAASKLPLNDYVA